MAIQFEKIIDSINSAIDISGNADIETNAKLLKIIELSDSNGLVNTLTEISLSESFKAALTWNNGAILPEVSIADMDVSEDNLNDSIKELEKATLEELASSTMQNNAKIIMNNHLKNHGTHDKALQNQFNMFHKKLIKSTENKAQSSEKFVNTALAYLNR